MRGVIVDRETDPVRLLAIPRRMRLRVVERPIGIVPATTQQEALALNRVQVPGPLPDVPGHIERSEAGHAAARPNRPRSRAVTDVGRLHDQIGSRWRGCPVPVPERRQTLVPETRVGLSLEPAYPSNRMVFSAVREVAGRPRSRARASRAVNEASHRFVPRQVHSTIEERLLPELGRLVPAGVYERPVLRVGDLVTVDPEVRHVFWRTQVVEARDEQIARVPRHSHHLGKGRFQLGQFHAPVTPPSHVLRAMALQLEPVLHVFGRAPNDEGCRAEQLPGTFVGAAPLAPIDGRASRLGIDRVLRSSLGRHAQHRRVLR